MRLRKYMSDKRGISLIEVLAALSVFVVGILAVVRMFPPGFIVVKQSENVTLANRLAQGELERLKGASENLPMGILGWDIVNGNVLVDMNPEDLHDLPGASGDPYYSDVNKFRRIYAEATKIPSPITTPAWGDASMYVLNFSPIEWAGPDSVVVRSGPMRRRGVPDTGRTVRSTSEYAIDYDGAVLHVRPMSYPRKYIITYSYWVQTAGHPELRPVLSQTVVVPADTSSVNIPSASQPHVKSVTGFMYIDTGSDSLHRSFDLIAAGNVWDPTNPYQYKVLDNVRGVIGFNPVGYGYDEQTAWGKMALTAYIDYDVLDWHIIREEKKLPDASIMTGEADLAIRLTLRFIKNAGLTNVAPPVYQATVEMNGDTYAGLSAGLPFSILAIDIQNGEWFNEESQVGSGDFAMAVNYKDGIIKFHPTLAGRTFRIYYRAEGDWALQVFKSYETYRRSYNFSFGSQSPLDHREWFGPTTTASDGVPYFDDMIYFAKCYHGMSIAMDYTYRIGNGGQYFRVDGDSYQTDIAIGRVGTCGIDPRTRIAKLRGCSVSDVQITRITRVYGVSVGARVIWREGGRGFNPGEWKKVDLQTYLMRLED